MCTLDNALDSSYAQQLLSGKALPINYNTWVSQFQTIAGADNLIAVTRALTRLKSVFVTLDKARTGDRDVYWLKPWDDYFSPSYVDQITDDTNFNSSGEFQFHMQIESKLFPEYPIRSHAEAYYQLRTCLGVHASPIHGFSISGKQYRQNKLIIGIDCEKVLEAGWTGLNARAGDLLVVKLKYLQGLSFGDADYADRQADRAHIVLHSD